MLRGALAGAATLGLLLGVGTYTLTRTAGCGGTAVTLDVAAAPDIAPVVTRVTERFNDAGHETGGRCVKASVRSTEPATVAALLSGQGVTGTNRLPDVWIPDSSMWVMLARGGKGAAAQAAIGPSMALSPIVVALPATLAGRLEQQGITADPSWHNLLQITGATAGGAVTKHETIPAGTVRLLIPNPARSATGLGALMITNALLVNDPNRNSILAGIVRTARENTQPSVQAQFAQFQPGRRDKYPIAMAPEQAVWSFNRSGPAERAVALYPAEGTLSMDYPVTTVTSDRDKRGAVRLLEQALTGTSARDDLNALGFRAPDGRAPASFGPRTGVSPRRPLRLPSPAAKEVVGFMQTWFRLSLGLRLLTLLDISGTMAQPIAPGVTRLQATTRTAQDGLSLMPDDTELGLWTFSTKLQKDQDWRNLVPIGPLGERAGSTTRRQLLLSGLGSVEPKRTGDTGLFETLMAAYKEMTRTYKPEYNNAVVLLTDGKGNDDPDGPSLRRTLSTLQRETDPARPIDVILIGIGDKVDTRELKQIAKVVHGFVYVAETPQQITRIFLQAIATHIPR